jgi:hypothetical protein
LMAESLKGADLLDLIIETVLEHAYQDGGMNINCDRSKARKELSDKLVKWTHDNLTLGEPKPGARTPPARKGARLHPEQSGPAAIQKKK